MPLIVGAQVLVALTVAVLRRWEVVTLDIAQTWDQDLLRIANAFMVSGFLEYDFERMIVFFKIYSN